MDTLSLVVASVGDAGVVPGFHFRELAPARQAPARPFNGFPARLLEPISGWAQCFPPFAPRSYTFPHLLTAFSVLPMLTAKCKFQVSHRLPLHQENLGRMDSQCEPM